MPLNPGSKLGPYEILALIGAGGMGEVYRAKDTRLDRSVAVKILPAHFSSKADLRERFEREARAVSSLNHPNICTLHDVGQQDGVDYLVMELIDGESLASKLLKGPLPVDQALRIASEIASALDRAHRSGIVHRDLKPGNIMLTKSGAKLLDFGLVKLRSAGPTSGAEALSSLKTENRDLTGEGRILGTFQYMAPEQLEGKEADPRTDIFAFGSVLYEMLTGRRAFSGKSQASLIASILAAEPPAISTIQPMTPEALDRVVRTCLAKDPEDRWQTAHDVMLQLQWIAAGGSQAQAPAIHVARRSSRERIAWSAAALFLLAAIAMSVAYVRRAPAPAPIVRLQILPPDNTEFDTGDGPVTISPDGRQIVFLANSAGADSALWVRSLDSVEARKIEGSDDSYDPFWSPDGRFIAFGGRNTLWKVDVAGGPIQKITEMPDGRGGSWNRDNVILFDKSGATAISRIPAGGGTPEPATILDSARHETGHWRPHFLPDGKRFLFLVKSSEPQNEGIYVASLGSMEKTRLSDLNVAVTPVLPGFLLFVRERILMAQSIDFGRLGLAGDPLPLAKEVEYIQTWGTASFSSSDEGTLAHQGASRRQRQLAWLDRAGKQVGLLGEPMETRDDPRISPDGKFVAVSRLDPETRGADLWVFEMARGIGARLTSDPGNDDSPVWSPDGTRIVFESNRRGVGSLYMKAANGSGAEEPLLESDRSEQHPLDWSRDGRLLLYVRPDPKTGKDIWLLPMTGERKPAPLITSAFDQDDARFSPDGKWIAYKSDETGRSEVFVQPFPATGAKWQVSVGGGDSPRWRGDGKEIVYFRPRISRMAVEIKTSPAFEAGVPHELFQTPLGSGSELSADGQRLLISQLQVATAVSPITIVLNWTAGLKR